MKSESSGQSKKLFAQDRKMILLGALVLLILISVIYQWSSSPSPVATTSTTIRQPKTTTTSSSSGNAKLSPLQTPDPDVAFDQLQQKIPAPDPSGRNPFVLPPPPRPVNPNKSASGPNRQQAEIPKAVCGDRVCQPTENYENCPTDCERPLPPINLKYIGFMKEEDGQVAFFTDGREVFMGRQNDIVANKYRVLKINDDSVELGYLDVNQSKTIPFQGNEKS
ncbi:MAG: hypothetical protein C5B54_08465 [Acidobacteria bacterium]|nr:MAG: hypothetical protein C5B54_08465 [Acidobacteriota bacterium]